MPIHDERNAEPGGQRNLFAQEKARRQNNRDILNRRKGLGGVERQGAKHKGINDPADRKERQSENRLPAQCSQQNPLGRWRRA